MESLLLPNLLKRLRTTKSMIQRLSLLVNRQQNWQMEAKLSKLNSEIWLIWSGQVTNFSSLSRLHLMFLMLLNPSRSSQRYLKKLQLALHKMDLGNPQQSFSMMESILLSLNQLILIASQFCISRLMPNSTETQKSKTDHPQSMPYCKRVTKFHIRFMPIILRQLRDIKSTQVFNIWSKTKSMVTTTSKLLWKTQELPIASQKSSVHSKSTSMKAQTMQQTQASEMTTSCSRSSPTTSHQKKPPKEPSFLSSSLASSPPASWSTSPPSSALKPTSRTWVSGVCSSPWTTQAFCWSSSHSGSKLTLLTPCGSSSQ